MVTCHFKTGNGNVKMSTLIIKMLREAQVKEGPTGFNYQNHWKFSEDTKIHKSLYKHINQAVKSMLHLPIVSLRQLKQQLRNDDYFRQSILKSPTSGYNGKVLITANPDPQLPNNNYTPLLQPIYKLARNVWVELVQQFHKMNIYSQNDSVSKVYDELN